MIVDAHIHLWRRDLLPDEAVMGYLEPLQGPDAPADFGEGEGILGDFSLSMDIYQTIMRTNSIDRAVVLATDMGLVGRKHIDVVEHMEWFFDELSAYEDFVPFTGIDPRRDDAIDVMGSIASRHDPKGIKVYPACGFMPDDPSLTGFWDAVQDMGLVAVTHAGAAWGPLDERFCHPSNLAGVVERRDDLDLVVAHLGGKWREELYDLADRFENVYADTSALQSWLPGSRDVFENRLMEALDHMPGRVMFGTDWPLFEIVSPTQMMVDVISTMNGISEADREGLMGGTASGLLGI